MWKSVKKCRHDFEILLGDFLGGFFWALCPHKNEEKKSGNKIREKNLTAQQ